MSANSEAAATLPPESIGREPSPRTIAIVGNPNVGKTSVFNRLTSLFAKTANFSGTTVERRIGTLVLREATLQIVDLPGLYSLDAQSPDERIAKSFLEGDLNHAQPPDGILVVVDGTNLERSLFIAGQVLELRRPTGGADHDLTAEQHVVHQGSSNLCGTGPGVSQRD